MFHGYRGTSEKDLSGGIQRCRKLGHSAFIVDQRCSRESEGDVITFGIKEHRDCLSWVAFMVEHFGPDVRIILCGISMGAATVMTAAGCPLPQNVVGVLADCGFTSAEEIIKRVAGLMKMPPNLSYPFVRLGARIFGGFDLNADSALEAAKRCKLPLMLVHGEEDDFVPCEMSRRIYDV
jgi:pimeloyl-ACP methyl ester carboxylesterase